MRYHDGACTGMRDHARVYARSCTSLCAIMHDSMRGQGPALDGGAWRQTVARDFKAPSAIEGVQVDHWRVMTKSTAQIPDFFSILGATNQSSSEHVNRQNRMYKRVNSCEQKQSDMCGVKIYNFPCKGESWNHNHFYKARSLTNTYVPRSLAG